MKSQFFKTEKSIKDWLDTHKVQNYTLTPCETYGFVVSVAGSVDLNDRSLKKIPIKFDNIVGDFLCKGNQLTSLDFCPEIVNGFLDISKNHLKSLKGAPRTLGGNFRCWFNLLTSLKYCPQTIQGNFDCSFNQIKSLKNGPVVSGNYFCSHNKLISLKHIPLEIKGNFSCENNELQNLKYAPHSVGGDYNIARNKINNLKGSPQKINGEFNCSYNELTSFEAGPEEIEGHFLFAENKISSLEYFPKIKKGSKIYGQNNLFSKEIMKHLCELSTLPTPQRQLLQTREEIEAWLDNMGVKKYTIAPDLSVSVDSVVYINNKNLTYFPVNFSEVNGTFNCRGNKLTSLEGAPIKVQGFFVCENNYLTSLHFGPKEVVSLYAAGYNLIQTLEAYPQEFSGPANSLRLEYNYLSHIEVLPENLCWVVNLENNMLGELENQRELKHINAYVKASQEKKEIEESLNYKALPGRSKNKI